MKKKGVLLVNLGTPNSFSVRDVRKYLREFLMDKRVIDISYLGRWLLVNFIIAPFRSPKSAAEYQKLFDEKGSPLQYMTAELCEKVQRKMGDSFVVSYAMRYQNPSIETALYQLRKQCITSLHVIPLFPQYASASTGSVIEKVMSMVSKWQVIPNIKFTSRFLENELFIQTIVEQGRELTKKKNYDHYLFSYHGLPERQIKKSSVGNYCQLKKCCFKSNEKNHFCYRAQCFETTRLIANSLNISQENYTVCFQSRLGKDPWIKPYTDKVLESLAQKGTKKILVFSPAFVSDCLETTVEVGDTYRNRFLALGGEEWDLVPSLNIKESWVQCLYQLIKEN